ncbi:hypothetical protein EJ06DRAFT_506704, partial [Trichodelitschia bisporula]
TFLAASNSVPISFPAPSSSLCNQPPYCPHPFPPRKFSNHGPLISQVRITDFSSAYQ